MNEIISEKNRLALHDIVAASVLLEHLYVTQHVGEFKVNQLCRFARALITDTEGVQAIRRGLARAAATLHCDAKIWSIQVENKVIDVSVLHELRASVATGVADLVTDLVVHSSFLPYCILRYLSCLFYDV